MWCGIDQLHNSELSALRRRLRDSRVAVLTHAAAVDRRGRQTLSILEELGAAVRVVFAPEHGFSPIAQAEEAVSAQTASAGSGALAPVVSLYGKTKEELAPRPEQLENVELLVIDLVDVGSRYYTYVWTALLAARAARARGVHTIVLDRPNPISGDPESGEGILQEPNCLSFVGLEPVPIRHALTIGELLCLFLERDREPLGPDGALSVVPVRGWERCRTADAWGRPFVMPSPNMPTLETAQVYPGGGLLEGTNLSEGRGTTAPFQLIGAPFLDGLALAQELERRGAPGVWLRPVAFRPTFDKFQGQVCQGIMLHVTQPRLFRPVATFLALIHAAYRQAPDQFVFRDQPYEFETEVPAFDLLTGSARARRALLDGASAEELIELVSPVSSEWPAQVLAAEERALRASA